VHQPGGKGTTNTEYLSPKNIVGYQAQQKSTICGSASERRSGH